MAWCTECMGLGLPCLREDEPDATGVEVSGDQPLTIDVEDLTSVGPVRTNLPFTCSCLTDT